MFWVLRWCVTVHRPGGFGTQSEGGFCALEISATFDGESDDARAHHEFGRHVQAGSDRAHGTSLAQRSRRSA